jgi:hypothetical protein
VTTDWDDFDGWATALESGDYKQGVNALANMRDDGSYEYCCLGVLCRWLKATGALGIAVTEGAFGDVIFDGQESVLPETVTDFTGLCSNPVLEIPADDWRNVLASVSSDQLRDELDDLRDKDSEHAGCQRSRPGTISLADLNDAKVPFREIARLIRKYLKKESA